MRPLSEVIACPDGAISLRTGEKGAGEDEGTFVIFLEAGEDEDDEGEREGGCEGGERMCVRESVGESERE